MKWQRAFRRAAVSLVVLVAAFEVAHGQGRGGQRTSTKNFLVPADQVVAVRAGRLWDAGAGAMVNNQVVVIKGDRIVDVGATVAVPAGARVIDLSNATVLPGMIDAHVHTFPGGENVSEVSRALVAANNVKADLDAGFTTVLDMDSRGGWGTVDLRNAINAGLIEGPRMQVVGLSLIHI